MQKTATKAKSSSSYVKPALQKSRTLSRKYVKRPVGKKVLDVKAPAKRSKVVKSVKIAEKPAVAKKATKVKITDEKKAPVAAFKAKAKASELSSVISKSPSAKKMPIKAAKVEKSGVIRRFSSPKKLVTGSKIVRKKVKTAEAEAKAADAARLAIQKVATMDSPKPMRRHRGRRVLIAFACSAVVVAGIGTFVMLNMPNISVEVAAMQTGIDATYPKFTPRNYTMETVASDKTGRVTMNFVGPDGATFVLTEEKSTWDSNAVLNNYVKENYSANYATMHEQGITYYSDPGSAVWVNGGILYKITSRGKNLTREQIRNIVVSL